MGGLDVLRAEVPRGHFSRLEIPDTAGVRASACRAMLLGLSQLLVSNPLTRRQGDSEKLCHLPKATKLVLVAPAYECVCVCVLSRVCLFAALWTVASQAPLSIEFSRQEFWSGVLFPTPRDLPNPGIKSHPLCLLGWRVDYFH